jgi:hypothetical protein
MEIPVVTVTQMEMVVAWKHRWTKKKNRSQRSMSVEASLLFHREQVKREGENPR